MVAMNCAAIDEGVSSIVRIEIPAAWGVLEDEPEIEAGNEPDLSLIHI